jgi:hypothetical protein
MKKRIVPFLFSTLLSSLASASDFSGCGIVEIVLVGDQNAHVQLNCLISNRPACASAGNFFGFDKSTPAGKQYLAMVMAAQAMNATVEGFVDQNSCPAWQGNVALLVHLRVKK